MKSLALRALALIVLGGMTHALKPFTGDNLTSYVAITAHSLAAWLPTAAATRLEKTAAIASLLNNVWQTPTRMEAGLESMLALRVQPKQPALFLKRASQPRKTNAATAIATGLFAPEATDLEEPAVTDEVIASAAEETLNKIIQRATVAVPLPTETSSLPVLLDKKRAACPMPSVVATDEPVTAPETPKTEAEVEVTPTTGVEAQPVPMLQKRTRMPLEIESEPVSLQSIRSPARSLFNRPSATPSKC